MVKIFVLFLCILLGVSVAGASPVLEGNFFPHAADQAIRFRLTDCQGGAEVTLRLKLELEEEKWESWATFAACRSGFVVPEIYSPLQGSYEEADPMGLFWSMAPVNGISQSGECFFLDGLQPLNYKLIIEANGKVLQTRNFQRYFLAPGVEKKSLKGEDLAGTFFLPEGEQQVPGVLVLGGFGGEFHKQRAALLANRGYATLALDYFGKENLPQELADIPLEYFQNAVTWLEQQKRVNGEAIIILGHSRGAEAGLLLAAHDSRVGGVVGVSPSSMVWQGEGGGNGTSTWTLNGLPLPHLPFSPGPNGDGESLDGMLEGIENRNEIEEITIPVEKIRGPVLLVSGGEDRFWPSSQMAEMMVKRLEDFSFPYQVNHLNFPDAGHLFRIPYLPRSKAEGRGCWSWGGSPGINSRAEAESWQEILAFLANFK